MSLQLPCLLGGRYECRQCIGSGGMGEVFLARHLGLDRDVAVKVLSLVGIHAGQEDRVKERFRRESVALSRLRHPNTVQVIDYGWTDDARPYIVTELLQGQTLDILLHREGPLDVARTLHITIQIARSLAEAHQHGIVHRDLKPSNVFLIEAFGTRDYVKLIDFGVARIDDADPAARARPLTVEGTTLGTPDYMAPEQARGHKPAPATDVYALGCMMYEMLTGAPPFMADSALQVMIKHIKEEPARLADVRPELYLPPGFEHTLIGCLQKDLHNRPHDAGALSTLLEEVVKATAHPSLQEAPLSALDALFPKDDTSPRSPPSSDPDASGLLRTDRANPQRVRQATAEPRHSGQGSGYRKPLRLKTRRPRKPPRPIEPLDTATAPSKTPPSDEPLAVELNEDLIQTKPEEPLPVLPGDVASTPTKGPSPGSPPKAAPPPPKVIPLHRPPRRLEPQPADAPHDMKTRIDMPPLRRPPQRAPQGPNLDNAPNDAHAEPQSLRARASSPPWLYALLGLTAAGAWLLFSYL